MAFRAAPIHGEALALDPGGGGLIAAAIRGQQPSPQAFGFLADLPGPLHFDPEAINDGIVVLCLKGPIAHHAPSKRADEEYSWHSYEAAQREVECAMQSGMARAIVLKIDSPGGVAAGMGETHRALRRLSAKYRIPIYGYADELAASAGYHLISSCREVWTTPDGHLGSVGVILCTTDESAALQKAGIKVRYLVSGAYKADLHPGAPITDDVLARAQAKVDLLARHFWERVAKSRGAAPNGSRLSTPKAVAAMQAGVYIGRDAMRAGLCDGITSWDDFLGLVKKAINSKSGRSLVAAA